MPKVNLDGALTLDSFAAEIIVAKGLVEENRRALGKYQHGIEMQAEEVVQRAIVEALTDEQAMELTKKLDEGASDGEVEKFFENTGADYQGAIAKALEKFRAEKMVEDLIAEFGEGIDEATMLKEDPDVAGQTSENKNEIHDENLGGVNSRAGTEGGNDDSAEAVARPADDATQPTNTAAQPVNTAMQPAENAAQPVQGTTSEVQGASDVEGKTLANNMTEEA